MLLQIYTYSCSVQIYIYKSRFGLGSSFIQVFSSFPSHIEALLIFLILSWLLKRINCYLFRINIENFPESPLKIGISQLYLFLAEYTWKIFENNLGHFTSAKVTQMKLMIANAPRCTLVSARVLIIRFPRPDYSVTSPDYYKLFPRFNRTRLYSFTTSTGRLFKICKHSMRTGTYYGVIRTRSGRLNANRKPTHRH